MCSRRWDQLHLPLPHVRPYLLSMLTSLFSEIPIPRRVKAKKQEENTLLSGTSCSQVHRWDLQFSTVSHAVLSAQGHEGTWEMCYPLRTHELSMPDRVMRKRAVILGAEHEEWCLAKYCSLWKSWPIEAFQAGHPENETSLAAAHWGAWRSLQFAFSAVSGFGLGVGCGELGWIRSGAPAACPFL